MSSTGAQRRKRYGCSGIELMHAFGSLSKYTLALIKDQNDGVKVDVEEEMLRSFDEVLSWMNSRLQGPRKTIPFSSTTSDTLDESNIKEGPLIVLNKAAVDKLTQSSTSVSSQTYMTSADFYRHLNMLTNLVSYDSKASARLWIDAFLFRASVLLSPGKRMVLRLEDRVPDTKVGENLYLAGHIDYTAVVADNDETARWILENSHIEGSIRTDVLGFCIVEAKKLSTLLSEHIPQAVSEIYACAVKMKKSRARGALTNGKEWIFIAVSKSENDVVYSHSRALGFNTNASLFTGPDTTVTPPDPDAIAVILANWIEHSFDDISEDECFVELEQEKH